ncbi:hypothetical protein CEE44_04910 [Candidatus Woesearchaeota archaeon B3_Woes]|nr:MAG: hypothetical protein CEE44_04910 [Candidatus Woesearchaeota archaeon B3_Woes]
MKGNLAQKRKKVYGFFLSLPPLLALVMVFVLSFTSKTVEVAQEGLMLSPVKDGLPIIFSLVIYIIWHSLFVGILYRKKIEKVFLKISYRK